MRTRWAADAVEYAGLLLAAAGLLLLPEAAIAGGVQGLRLCAERVIPALFPFFVLSGLAVRMGVGDALSRPLAPVMRPLFGVGGACAPALLFGLLGGYPTGARTAAELYARGACSRQEAERLLVFCNNAGPAFLLSFAGVGLFGSVGAGFLLLGIHAFSAVLVGILFRRPLPDSGPRAARRPGRQALPEAVAASVTAASEGILNVTAYVMCFSVLMSLLRASGCVSVVTALLRRVGLSPAWGEALLLGTLELTGGLAALPSGAGTGAAAAALTGWGGLCVHLQTLSVLRGAGLRPRRYFAAKLLQAGISGALGALLFPIAGYRPAGGGPTISSTSPWPLAAICSIAICVFAVIVLHSEKKSRKRKPSGVYYPYQTYGRVLHAVSRDHRALLRVLPPRRSHLPRGRRVPPAGDRLP